MANSRNNTIKKDMNLIYREVYAVKLNFTACKDIIVSILMFKVGKEAT